MLTTRCTRLSTMYPWIKKVWQTPLLGSSTTMCQKSGRLPGSTNSDLQDNDENGFVFVSFSPRLRDESSAVQVQFQKNRNLLNQKGGCRVRTRHQIVPSAAHLKEDARASKKSRITKMASGPAIMTHLPACVKDILEGNARGALETLQSTKHHCVLSV